MNQPQIILTRLDAERLEHLLESLPEGAFPARESLQEEIARADIVDPREVPPDVVTMNSKVTFRVENNAREFSLRLVYPKDADGSPDKVSVLAPVGSALLGIRQGQSISWPMPGGHAARVEVIRVDEQPERSGNYAL